MHVTFPFQTVSYWRARVISYSSTMKDEYNFISIQANKEISKEIKFMIPFDSFTNE